MGNMCNCNEEIINLGFVPVPDNKTNNNKLCNNGNNGDKCNNDVIDKDVVDNIQTHTLKISSLPKQCPNKSNNPTKPTSKTAYLNSDPFNFSPAIKLLDIISPPKDEYFVNFFGKSAAFKAKNNLENSNFRSTGSGTNESWRSSELENKDNNTTVKKGGKGEKREMRGKIEKVKTAKTISNKSENHSNSVSEHSLIQKCNKNSNIEIN